MIHFPMIDPMEHVIRCRLYTPSFQNAGNIFSPPQPGLHLPFSQSFHTGPDALNVDFDRDSVPTMSGTVTLVLSSSIFCLQRAKDLQGLHGHVPMLSFCTFPRS
jgi:hypothetical protein